MTPNAKYSFLSEGIYREKTTKGVDYVCRFCEEPIKPGNYYVRRKMSSGTFHKVVYYHTKCWEYLQKLIMRERVEE